MNNRANRLRAIEFGYPDYIPVEISVTLASRIEHQGEIEAVMAKFPEFFPSFVPGKTDYAKYGDGTCDIIEHDAWGYDWHYKNYGLEGFVINHPLEDWENFETYTPPNSDLVRDRGGAWDWDALAKDLARKKREGYLAEMGLVHGFLFLRLQYLRGFENAMMDMALEEPQLFELIQIIDRENEKLVRRFCAAGAEIVGLPEDLGAEHAMVISREMFQTYIAPSYRKLVALCRANGAKVMIHSDGYILPIIGDLIDIGMDIINPQDLCNGIDNLAKTLKGRACIRLDLDRVHITPKGSRSEIFELIEEEIKVLGSKEGGLEFIYGVYPPTGPEQLAYVCEAFRKYRTYFRDK